MRKSGWLLASSILLVGFGFGHAGCYTSGLPGGHGAAGASNGEGDAGTSGGAGGGGNSTGDSGTCKSASDCESLHCTAEGVCVACITDTDCSVEAKGGASGTGGSSAVTDNYCIQNECNSFVRCQDSRDCGTDQVCDGTTHHCLECVTDVDCGANQRCAGHKCLDKVTCTGDKDCKATNQVCNVSLQYCVDCLVSESCKDGLICGNGLCACTAGMTRCESTGLARCVVEVGYWGAPVACAPNLVCQDSDAGAVCQGG